MKACQGVGGRTQTQAVDQKRTASTGMSNGKVMRKIPKFTATLVDVAARSVSECECVRVRVSPRVANSSETFSKLAETRVQASNPYLTRVFVSKLSEAQPS